MKEGQRSMGFRGFAAPRCRLFGAEVQFRGVWRMVLDRRVRFDTPVVLRSHGGEFSAPAPKNSPTRALTRPRPACDSITGPDRMHNRRLLGTSRANRHYCMYVMHKQVT